MSTARARAPFLQLRRIVTRRPDNESRIADAKQRSYPGDLAKGEIKVLRPGEFDENGPHVQLLFDHVEFPGGRQGKLGRLTRSPEAEDGVVIVPITEKDEVVLVHQFRHAPRVWTWELPRGGTEAGETPGAAVHAELLEEIGYQAADAPFSLGRVMPDSGAICEIPYVYAIRVRPHPTKSAKPDPKERIVGHEAIPYAELWDLCVRGEINDALTMAAVLRLHPHFENGRFEIDQRYIHKYSLFKYQRPQKK